MFLRSDKSLYKLLTAYFVPSLFVLHESNYVIVGDPDVYKRQAGDYTHHGNFQGTKVQGLGATVFLSLIHI